MSKRFLWVLAVALVIAFVGGYLAAVDVVGAHAERMERARAEAEARAAAAAVARGLERTILDLRGRVRLQARELSAGAGPEVLTQLEERIGKRAKAQLVGEAAPPPELAALVRSAAAGGAVVGFAAGEVARLAAAAPSPAVEGAEARTLLAVIPIAPSLLSAEVELRGTHLVAQLGGAVVASTLSAKVDPAAGELVVDGVRFVSSTAAVRDDAGAELKIAAYAPLEAALPFSAALRVVFLIAGGGALAFLFLGAGLLAQRTPVAEAGEVEPADEPEEEGLAAMLEGDELGARMPSLGEPTVPSPQPDRLAREAEMQEAAAREAEAAAREAEAAAALEEAAAREAAAREAAAYEAAAREAAAREAAAREAAAREAAAREAAAYEAAARDAAAREAAAYEAAAREAAAREAAAYEAAAREAAARDAMAHPTPDPFAGNVAGDGLRAALGESARREVVPMTAFAIAAGFGDTLPDPGDRATRRGASSARPAEPGYLPPLPDLGGAGLSGDLRVPGAAAPAWTTSPEPRSPTQGKGASPAPRPRAGPEAPLPVGTGTWSPPPPEALSRPPAPVGPDARPFDEEHYRVVFNDFVAAKERLGENVEAITYEGFSAKLRASERQLLEKHGCRAVRFQVVVKERTVSLRPQLVR